LSAKTGWIGDAHGPPSAGEPPGRGWAAAGRRLRVLTAEHLLADGASLAAPVLSGRTPCSALDDGTEIETGPGEITSLPEGHDAWVLGDELVVTVDWFGASNYAKTQP
jgi:hypothetical protein